MLADVSERMVTSLNPEETLQSVAEAVVPAFADWCVVDLATASPWLEMVARAHRDPEKVALIEELRRRYPPGDRTNPRHAIYRAVENRATIREAVRDEDLQARAVDDEHLRLLRALGIGSHIVAPLVARGRVVGAVSFVRSPERDRFDDAEVLTAEGIARRTALATDNAQLYRAAQDAIELRDRFLAVASHELRNPLMVVRGHWELLERRIDPHFPTLPEEEAERIQTSLRRLGQGVEQLRRLIEDLLDVDRLRHGVVQLERTRVDLVELVREAVEDVPGDAATARVRLTLPDEPLVGQWDPARLRQVVDNMIGNALKYSEADHPVDVTVAKVPDGVRVSVTDRGIGIPLDRLESIFEPFNRAPNAASLNYPGLGLGLAISRELVGQLGGRMWAESGGEGKGSTFSIELTGSEAGTAPAQRPSDRPVERRTKGGTPMPDAGKVVKRVGRTAGKIAGNAGKIAGNVGEIAGSVGEIAGNVGGIATGAAKGAARRVGDALPIGDRKKSRSSSRRSTRKASGTKAASKSTSTTATASASKPKAPAASKSTTTTKKSTTATKKPATTAKKPATAKTVTVRKTTTTRARATPKKP